MPETSIEIAAARRIPAAKWQPDRPTPDLATATSRWPMPPTGTALLRGLRGLCPSCGQARMFSRFLRVVETCPNCHAPLGAVRADDAPPYFTIVVVGHVIIVGMLLLEKAAMPPLWVHAAIWLPLTLLLTIGLLQPVKGATVGLMLKFGLITPDRES